MITSHHDGGTGYGLELYFYIAYLSELQSSCTNEKLDGPRQLEEMGWTCEESDGQIASRV